MINKKNDKESPFLNENNMNNSLVGIQFFLLLSIFLWY